MNRNPDPYPGGLRRLIGPDVGWIGAQIALLGAGIVGGVTEWLIRGRGFVVAHAAVTAVAGAAFLLLAAVVFVRSSRDLADNLTMSPTPVDDCQLVNSGIYGVVRHPMYLGLMLTLAGIALLFGSWIALVATAALAPVLYMKARHEERLLRERFPDYAAYARRVPHRFIPRVL